MRDKTEQKALSSLLQRSATEPLFGTSESSHSAATKLATGMRRMASLQPTSRRIVSLPVLPGSVAHPPQNMLPTLPGVLGAIPATTSASPPSVNPVASIGKTNVSIEVTAAENTAAEAEKVKLDRLAAEMEWTKYLTADTEGISDGLNLVRSWDVSTSTDLFSLLLSYYFTYRSMNGFILSCFKSRLMFFRCKHQPYLASACFLQANKPAGLHGWFYRKRGRLHDRW